MATVYEILRKIGSVDYRNTKKIDDYGIEKHEYEAVNIHEVKINERPFTNYGQYQFVWEKTYVKSPERSASGSLGNLNSYATFLTPHLIMDFSIMSIDDYREIMRMHYESNEFVVKCYDPIYDRQIKVKMYFATEEMAKLYTIAQNRLLPRGQWEEWVDLVGVIGYQVEMIGTNNDLDLVSVRYEYNAPKDDSGNPIYPNGSPVPDQYEEDIYLGEEIVVGANSTFKEMPPSNKWQFSTWEAFDENGNSLGYRSNGLVMTINSPIYFKAVWKPTTSYTLSFNYGLSDVYTEVNPNTSISEKILNTTITNVNNIGLLPPITAEPSVKGTDGKLYYPYTNGAWYKYPVKQEDMKVISNQAYWTDRDSIIYALYDKKVFTVSYVTGVPNTSIPVQNLYYQDKVYLPTLARSGYSFQGWYVDAELKKAFSGTMPPYPIILYAKWVQE